MKRIVGSLAVLALTATVAFAQSYGSADTNQRVIAGATYSCQGERTQIVVRFADGTGDSFAGFRCSEEAVATAIGERYSLPHRQQTTLQSSVDREESFTDSPGTWLGNNWVRLIVYAVATVVGLGFLFSNMYIVRQKTVVIVERFGKYVRTQQAGLRFKIPFVENASEPISLRQQEVELEVDTKTKDNVFMDVFPAVQYRITDPVKFYYELEDFLGQVKTYTFNIVRAVVPKMDMNDVYEKKDELAELIEADIKEKLGQFGIEVIDVPIKDLAVPEEIEAARNEKVRQESLRLAAVEQAAGSKVLVIAAAEAQKERDRLHGEGIAAFRHAVAHGINTSMAEVKKAAPGLTDNQISALLVTTQYLDALKDVAGRANSNTVFLPGGPSGGQDVFVQMTAALAADRGADNGPGTTAPPVVAPEATTSAVPAAS